MWLSCFIFFFICKLGLIIILTSVIVERLKKANVGRAHSSCQVYGKHLLDIQFNSVAQSCPNFCDPMDCSTPSFPVYPNSQNLLKLKSVASVMPSNHLLLCHPLPLLPSSFPSIRIFSNVSVLCIRRPKYWSFSFSISPFNEHSGLISFRINWLDLLAVQGTLSNTTVQKHQFLSA